jgi:phosphoserine phosphatase
MDGKSRADWAPFELIIFDCDSTLTTVEGIDELARWRGLSSEVEALTQAAMNGDVPLESVYGERLEMLKPTRAELRQLGQLYRRTALPGADRVIGALQAAGRQVFIVSGGLLEAVLDFGIALAVPADHIFAVGMEYDQLSGRWWEGWRHPRGRNPDEQYLAHDGGPLTTGTGKVGIIQTIRRQRRGRAMLVGDGSSDLQDSAAVDLFVGFGGVVARAPVAAAAEVFIRTPNLSVILPMAFGPGLVPDGFADLYQDGLKGLRGDDVAFRNPGLLEALLRRAA